jgi:hypothetical protein
LSSIYGFEFGKKLISKSPKIEFAKIRYFDGVSFGFDALNFIDNFIEFEYLKQNL